MAAETVTSHFQQQLFIGFRIQRFELECEFYAHLNLTLSCEHKQFTRSLPLSLFLVVDSKHYLHTYIA